MPIDYKKIYDEDYFNGKKSFFWRFGYGNHVTTLFDNRFKQIAKYVSEIGAGKILDVGCAYGFMLEKFPDTFQKFGIDISEYAIEIARKKFPDADFKIGGAENNLPYEENFFDIIVLNDTLEHLENPEKALRNIYRVLKKNGLLYITTPNLNILRRLLFGYADKREHHLSLFSHSDLANLLKKSGFKISEQWTYAGFSVYWRTKSIFGIESGFICKK